MRAPSRAEESAVVAAARAGDQAAFAALVERHRHELRVHCYRMLGSLDDSEDLMQETFLRAWRARESFEGRSSFRAWLYRIATNACLDALAYSARRVLPHQVDPPVDQGQGQVPRPDLPWLQPYPDRLLEPMARGDTEPATATVARETMELAFLAAIQHLPPRQRAVLILRDVLGWSAKDAAGLLEASVASANSALQRARATLKERLPERRTEWAPSAETTREERVVLQRYLDAMARADVDAIAELLAREVRATMPPFAIWHDGREPIIAALTASFDPASPDYQGRFLMVPTGANHQPAAAAYVLRPGEERYHAFAIGVFRIEGGQVVEITSFMDPDLFPAFGLPRSRAHR